MKEVADLSGVSVRTLHHYDEIGLLKPSHIGQNRYRYYDRDNLLRLQQILLHRELRIPLSEIAAILDAPGFDRLAALKMQREKLAAEAERYTELVRTIDRTILDIKGESEMKTSAADLYKGVTPEKQAEYESWLIERYGEGMAEDIALSKETLEKLSEHNLARKMNELQQVEADLAEGLRREVPADSVALDPLLTRHRAWVSTMWGRACTPEAYAGLADLYLSHPDFTTRYEGIAPGFTAYLTTAMKAHAERHANKVS